MIVEGPNGEELEFPDTMSEQEVAAVMRAHFPPGVPSTPEPNPRAWSDVPAEAFGNIPASAGKFATGLYEAATSPLETVKAVGDVAAGGVRAGLRAIIPGMEGKGNADTQRQDEMAAAAWQALKARYGSEEAIKRTLATDPVGALADIGTIATGGGAAATKVGNVANLGRVARAGEIASSVGKWADPVYLGARGMQGAGNAATAIGRELSGKLTGVGGESLGIAYDAGKQGGDVGQAYRDTIKGKVSGETVVNDARAAVEVMYKQRGDDYAAAKAAWQGPSVPLNFAPIDKLYADLVASTVTNKGFSKIGAADQAVLAEIGAKIDDFKQLHPQASVDELDALKQSIGNIVATTPSHTQQSRFINTMKHGVKREIAKQHPEYNAAMQKYSNATDQIEEIRNSLGLTDKATVESALRKLTSLTRNNVNTAYGRRIELAKELEDASGKPLLPQIAALANREIMPRGIQGAITPTALSAAAGASMNPWILAGLAGSSPRLMSGVAHGAGIVAGAPRQAYNRLTSQGLRDMVGQGPAMRQTPFNAIQYAAQMRELEEQRKRRNR